MSINWLSDFKSPPAVFRPVPFWSWNERIEPAEVRRQVDLMADAGLGGGFIHSRVGLITPYLGEEWFRAADAAIEQCRKHGLKIWLYDEDKWPSGFSGGTVPLADEEFRMKALIARPVGAAVPDDAKPVGPAVHGLQVYRWTSPLGYDWFNGTCYSDLMSRQAMRKFLDDAYESYYRRYGALYGREIVAEFTDEPCSIFRGRLPAGAVPYTTELPERFREMHGYDPIERLHLLFTDSFEAPQFRVHYFRTVNDLFEHNFSKQLGDWCVEHNIDLTGHYMLEHELYGQQCWGVKIMPNYRHQGIPGIDHLSRQIHERITAKQCHSVVNQYGKKRMLSELYGCSGGSLSFEDRLWMASQQMCLGVNLLNHHLSLYTLAGCRKRDYPQNMFYPQPWWPLNRVIDDPLSRTCVALAQGAFVAEALIIHPQESAFALWQSRGGEMPAELVGEGHVWDRNPTVPGVAEQFQELDRQVKAVMDTLLGNQRTFDFGDETILADDGEVVTVNAAPHLRIRQMDYPLVILPSMQTIATSTVDLLEQFQKAGGRVLLCGRAPQWLDGAPSDRLDRWVETLAEVNLNDLPKRVRGLAPPAVELMDADAEDARMLYVHIRQLDDGDRLVYLTNLHRVRQFNARVRCAGKWQSVHVLDTATGQRHELVADIEAGGAVVSLPFAPTQSHILLLSQQPAGDRRISLLPPRIAETVDLPPSAWKVERLDDNAICLEYAAWREGDGEWSTRPLPVIAIQTRLNQLKYDGPLALRYPVRVSKLSPARKVHLVVEYPERYRISVNGQEVQYAGLPFWRDIRWSPIDITGMLKDGENEIELRCAQFQHGDLTKTHDPFGRYGTEIESIYLVGDFAVNGQPIADKPISQHWDRFELPPIHVQCFREHSFALAEPRALTLADTTLQGLPFYAGRLKLTAELPRLNRNGRCALEIEHLDAAVAEVAVDDQLVGHFVSHPLRVDLSRAISAGARRVSITLYGTLRNLLGPHHHVQGEMPSVGPGHFHPGYGSEPNQPEWILRWMRGEVQPKDWLDRYCMVSFGHTGQIALRLLESGT